MEMAVVMVALIPTFLYMLTSDDLLRYRLNLQEVAVASPWDYTHLNYESSSVAGNALVQNLQQRYTNINIGHSGGDVSEAGQGRDRTAPMTFAGWNEEGSKKVECKKTDIADELVRSSQPAQKLAPPVNNGGLYSCEAALGVRNVHLITDFLQEWAGDMKLSEKEKGQAWGLNRQVSSVAAGTWAMTRVEDVNPSTGDHQKFLRLRVQDVYSGSSKYSDAHSKAKDLAQKGEDIGVLDAGTITRDNDMGNGDDTKSAEVGFSTKTSPQTSGNSGFDASPWNQKGASNDTYKQAHQNRTNAYMGRELQ